MRSSKCSVFSTGKVLQFALKSLTHLKSEEGVCETCYEIGTHFYLSAWISYFPGTMC